RPLRIPAPVGAEFYIQHLDRQGIAALGAFDMDRAGEDVASEMGLELRQDLAVLGQHVHRWLRQDLSRSRNAMDGRDVARLDPQRRFELAVEIAPVAGLR